MNKVTSELQIKVEKKTVHSIVRVIESLPKTGLNEILDYAQFIKKKYSKPKKVLRTAVPAKRNNFISETSLFSESSLKKDWLKPEEDEAWKNL